MPVSRRPDYAQIGFDALIVSVSVSSSTSAAAAGTGPFAGLFFKTQSSVSIVTPSGLQIDLDAVAKNSTIWIQGAYVAVIATATSVYALL